MTTFSGRLSIFLVFSGLIVLALLIIYAPSDQFAAVTALAGTLFGALLGLWSSTLQRTENARAEQQKQLFDSVETFYVDLVQSIRAAIRESQRRELDDTELAENLQDANDTYALKLQEAKAYLEWCELTPDEKAQVNNLTKLPEKVAINDYFFSREFEERLKNFHAAFASARQRLRLGPRNP